MTPETARRQRAVRGVALAAAVGLLVVVGTALFFLRPSYLKVKAEQKLAQHLNLEVAIESVSVSFWPRPAVTATGLVFRVPASPDLPPFVTIDRVRADVGLFSAWRGHVSAVRADGLRISVPPRKREDPPAPKPPVTPRDTSGEIVVDLFETENAVLTMLRSDPAREPLVFSIHRLRVDGVGFDRVMSFSTSLTNPVPEGLVESDGWFGPWNRDDPTDIPLGGTYTFSLANLGTIRGIAGTLTSAGDYQGRLTHIDVTGETHTPDFSLDMGGKPLPLTARFDATIDGSDGTTILNRVDAMLFETAIVVRGSVENLPGPGRQIELEADIPEGRIEDVLALAIGADQPALVGDVTIKSRISLPPGKTPVRDRLVLSGTFGLADTQFTDPAAEARLIELSRRSQGKDKDESASRVVTSLRGRFTMASGVLTLKAVAFRVPGATVTVDGTYGIASTELDLVGSLRMQASVSSAVGGFKSLFIKPFDWLFRRDGAGAVIPITVRGTVKDPDIGVSVRRVLNRGRQP